MVRIINNICDMKLPTKCGHIIIKTGQETQVSVSDYQFLSNVYAGIERKSEPVVMKKATEPAEIVCVSKKRKKTK